MDNWYVASAINNSAYDFLHMFWCFHDFRIIEVNYSAEKDSVDVLFEYDDMELRILLHFKGNVRFYVASVDFEAEWISEASLRPYDHQMQWVGCEMSENESVELLDNVSFFQGDSLKWAIVDKDGKTIPVTNDYLHQCWHIYNYQTHQYVDEYHNFTVTPA